MRVEKNQTKSVKEYFPHDFYARNDPRIRRLILKSGPEGIGLYWCIIEMLYEQGGYMTLDNIEAIAFELHSQSDRITDVLKNFDLFKFKDSKFYSESVIRRLKLRKNISEQNKQNTLKRWNKGDSNDATALQSQSDRNAIKEKKRKGKKKKYVFIPPTQDEVKKYFTENGYKESAAITAFNHYQLGEWYDSKGNAVLNWKQKMHSVWFKPENEIKKEQLIMPC